MNFPTDLKYAVTHEWVRVEGNLATIGISDHAQKELSDVVFVELPKIGQKMVAGKECAVVESVKAASDIYAPVDGEVISVNEELVSNSSLVNMDPYGKGWFFKVKLSNPSQVDHLKTAEVYRQFVGK